MSKVSKWSYRKQTHGGNLRFRAWDILGISSFENDFYFFYLHFYRKTKDPATSTAVIEAEREDEEESVSSSVLSSVPSLV